MVPLERVHIWLNFFSNYSPKREKGKEKREKGSWKMEKGKGKQGWVSARVYFSENCDCRKEEKKKRKSVVGNEDDCFWGTFRRVASTLLSGGLPHSIASLTNLKTL